MSEQFTEGLNPAQKEAVVHGSGPLLVLAGAGSGKTRVITHRIARLVTTGNPPASIMAVSFTNKAAAEMTERMVPLIGRSRTDKLWLSTFHRFGVRFLTEESKALGFPSRFVIFDQGDAMGAVREIVKREGLGDRKLDLWAVHSRISLWKNMGLTPDEVPTKSDYEYDVIARATYPHYETTLRNMCAVDFDDLVLLPMRILKEREDIREKWRQRFRFLMVDEFQDTNGVQLELVQLLTNAQRNTCVVGDDDQSIYGWRGADVRNILDFEKHFKGAKVVKLEDNYRSRSPILEVANAAISRSKRKRHDKTLRAARGIGAKVRMCTMADAETEAIFVAKEIRDLCESGVSENGIAVLYRSNMQGRVIEEELRAEGIAYRLFGGTQFFDRKEVKDAVAFLRVVVNPHDELSLRRVINYPPRGIGDVTMTRVQRYALVHGITFPEAMARLDDLPEVSDAAKTGARNFFAALERTRQDFKQGHSFSSITAKLFQDIGLETHLTSERGTQAERRWGNIQYVLKSLRKYEEKAAGTRPTMAQFLTRLSLRIDSEEEQAGAAVTLSSLHASKGLEFDVVFLLGLNEGQLPHSRVVDPKATEAAPTDVEEERRLFYVGVTRARERLYLCRPKRRALRGKVVPLTPTRFLEGLPPEHIEHYEREDDAPVTANEAVDMGKALLASLRGKGK